MDIKEGYKQVLNDSLQLITEPQKFWESRKHVALESDVFKMFFLPLVVIVGVAIFLGELITSSEFLFSYAIFKSLREVVVFILEFYAASYLTNELLTGFGGTKNKPLVKSVIAYSMLPFLVVAAITGLFPALYVLGILSLYGIALFVLGVKVCLNVPDSKRLQYILITLLANFVTFAIINVTSWKLFQAFFSYGA